MSWEGGLWPPMRPYAVRLVSLAGDNVRVTSVYRSYTHQLNLWTRYQRYLAAGLTPDEIARRYGLFTPAPPGRSKHQYGLAFDLSGSDEWLRWLGAVWQSWGGRWSPRDKVHYEV